MTRQVAKIIQNGTWKIVHNDKYPLAPYLLYYESWGHGCKLVNKYADVPTCLMVVTTYLTQGRQPV